MRIQADVLQCCRVSIKERGIERGILFCQGLKLGHAGLELWRAPHNY